MNNFENTYIEIKRNKKKLIKIILFEYKFLFIISLFVKK